jgi:hypothetical protein
MWVTTGTRGFKSLDKAAIGTQELVFIFIFSVLILI